MTTHFKKRWAIVLLCILTLAGLLSIYQTLFDLWMTAYPYATTGDWATRFYVRLATTIVIGVLWTTIVVWLVRQKHGAADRSKNGIAASKRQWRP
jgi:hypothetical protein